MIVILHRLLQTSSPDGGKSSLETLKDFALIVLAIIAVVLVLTLLTYLSAVASDYLIRFDATQTGLLDIDRCSLTRKANLLGLRTQERELILQQLFKATTFLYSEETLLKFRAWEIKHDKSVGDIEMGLVKTGKDPDVKDINVVTTDEIQDSFAKKEGSSAKDFMGAAVLKVKGDSDALALKKCINSDREPKSSEIIGALVATESTSSPVDPSSDAGTSAAALERTGNATKNGILADDVNDADHERMCCICLVPYGKGDIVMTGTQCRHLFHLACCQKWLLKHDHCPYCRKEMMMVTEFRTAAMDVLGEERVAELSMGLTPPPSDSEHTATGTPARRDDFVSIVHAHDLNIASQQEESIFPSVSEAVEIHESQQGDSIELIDPRINHVVNDNA